MKKKREEIMIFLKKCLRTPNPPDELAQHVSKKSFSDELFLHLIFESSESDRFPIIHMIRIRFFWPGEKIREHFGLHSKPEEREFVADSGASMHMISKKDLSNAELETVTTSRSPTTVKTANGEVQTNEETTVYVKELEIFLTMNVLEDTPAVLSLGKHYDEHGYSYEWINGQKPHLI